MIHLTRRERTEAALRNAWAKSAHYDRAIPVDLDNAHDLLVNILKQGISIVDNSDKKLREKYPRMFE